MENRMVITYDIHYNRSWTDDKGTAKILKASAKTVLVECGEQKFRLKLSELKDGAKIIRSGYCPNDGGSYYAALKVKIQ